MQIRQHLFPAGAIRPILFLLSFVAPTYFALPLGAATYWVSPTGAANWSACAGTIPLSGTAACSLSTANSSAVAGDLVYLRAGTYAEGAIQPSNRGTGTPPSGPWNFITFMAFTGETPIISTSGTGDPLNLSGLSYIRVSGITFTMNGQGAFRLQQGSNHNELDNNIFSSPNGWPLTFLLNANATASWSTQNWIHNNTFDTEGSAHGSGGTGCTDGGGDSLDIGVPGGVWGQITDLDNNNSIENNVFAHNPHAAVDGYGEYNVFRGNIFHNEPWSSGCTLTTNYVPAYTNSAYNGLYSHRDAQFTEDYQRVGTFNLFEGNRWGYAGINQANAGSEDFDLATPQTIFRYNFLYASMGTCFQFKYGWGGAVGSGGNGGTYNRVYNNTFYDCGIGWPAAVLANGSGCNTTSCPLAATAIMAYNGASSALGDVLKNNLIYDPDSLGFATYHGDVLNQAVGGSTPPFSPSSAWGEMASAGNNWCTSATGLNAGGFCSASGNPQFNNPDISNPSSTTLPDLNLQASSPAIAGGTNLTTATNVGTNSTTLTVADALYFQDGTWGSDLARSVAGLGGTFQADWIAIGTVTNTVQVQSVAYGPYNAPAGTITLTSPMTWTNGAPIWLYKKSDSSPVLSGKAPNYGAGEYTGTTPASPNNVKGTLVPQS